MEMRGETCVERFLGCLIVGMMPDEGLEEALVSLAEMWRFYIEAINIRPATRQLPEAVDAAVVEHGKRRELVID